MMLAKFRNRYPQGSLVSELVKIDRGTYIVKALVQIDNVVLATALAGADTVESAEDAARERAIATLFLDSHLTSNNSNSATVSTTNDSNLAPQTQTELVVEVEPLVKQKPLNEPKIVNFSQPQAEVSSRKLLPLETKDRREQDLSAVTISQNSVPATDAMLDNSLEESAVPQTNLEADEVKEPVQSAPISSNLFGDTFTAEIPEAVSLSDKNVVGAISETDLLNTTTSEMEAMDFNEIKQKTDIEIKRLSWTKDQGKEFLMSHYGKRSRLHLTDEQLLEFLRYLEKLPNPIK
ncbi:MAG: hypothetical protein WBM86_03655 [Waterburya sp.]